MFNSTPLHNDNWCNDYIISIYYMYNKSSLLIKVCYTNEMDNYGAMEFAESSEYFNFQCAMRSVNFKCKVYIKRVHELLP